MKYIIATAVFCSLLTILAPDAHARFANPGQLRELADDGCNVRHRMFDADNPNGVVNFPSNRCLCSITKCVAYYIGDDGGIGVRYAEDNVKRCNPLPPHPYSIQDPCHMMMPGQICDYLDTENPCDGWNPGVAGTEENGGGGQ